MQLTATTTKTKKLIRKNNDPFVIELAVCDDVHQILTPCPRVGQGVHHAILGAVSELALLGYSPEEIPAMVEEWVKAAGTTPYPREIPDALVKVFGSDDPRLRGETFGKAVTWPVADFSVALKLAEDNGARTELQCLYNLTDASPIDFDSKDLNLTTEDWLDMFYGDDDLLCIGEYKFYRDVKSRSRWRGHVRNAQYISPNPFRSEIWGRKNDNVRERRYLITEMDIKPKDTVRWVLLRSYRFHPFDVQAAVILHLQNLQKVKLLSVVQSGNKHGSLHALWKADADESVNLDFMRTAVGIGVDKAGWTLSQFARIFNPGAPQYQEIFYLDQP